MGSTYAVIIAVENYQQSGIKPVKFAAADANAFRALLLQRFLVPEANIKLWIDSDATQNRLLNDLPYEIKRSNNLRAGTDSFSSMPGMGSSQKARIASRHGTATPQISTERPLALKRYYSNHFARASVRRTLFSLTPAPPDSTKNTL
jgi:hypothetical protein